MEVTISLCQLLKIRFRMDLTEVSIRIGKATSSTRRLQPSF